MDTHRILIKMDIDEHAHEHEHHEHPGKQQKKNTASGLPAGPPRTLILTQLDPDPA